MDASHNLWSKEDFCQNPTVCRLYVHHSFLSSVNKDKCEEGAYNTFNSKMVSKGNWINNFLYSLILFSMNHLLRNTKDEKIEALHSIVHNFEDVNSL